MSVVSITLALAFSLLFLSWLEAREKRKKGRIEREALHKAINEASSEEIRPIGGRDRTK